MEQLRLSGNSNVEPTTVTYNVLIKAWSNSGKRNAGTKAIGVLRHMEQMYQNHLWNVRPNTTTYNTVIAALGKCGDVRRAERILLSMEAMQRSSGSSSSSDGDDDGGGGFNVVPNTITYNTYLDALARSDDDDAPDKAIAILSKMKKHQLHDNDDDGDDNSTSSKHSMPNTKTYNTVMNVVAKSKRRDAPYKAEKILNSMERLHAKNGGTTTTTDDDDDSSLVKPNAISYATLINAWGRSSNHDKVTKSLDVLRRMKKAHLDGNEDAKPNVYVYNSILNACSFVSVGGGGGNAKLKRAQALQVAMDIMKEMRTMSSSGEDDNVAPDHITYGAYFKVIHRNMSPSHERNRLISDEFNNCCKDGQVGNFVMREIQQLVGKKKSDVKQQQQQQNVTGVDFSIDIPRKIPPQWHRNVPMRMKPSSR